MPIWWTVLPVSQLCSLFEHVGRGGGVKQASEQGAEDTKLSRMPAAARWPGVTVTCCCRLVTGVAGLGEFCTALEMTRMTPGFTVQLCLQKRLMNLGDSSGGSGDGPEMQGLATPWGAPG